MQEDDGLSLAPDLVVEPLATDSGIRHGAPPGGGMICRGRARSGDSRRRRGPAGTAPTAALPARRAARSRRRICDAEAILGDLEPERLACPDSWEAQVRHEYEPRHGLKADKDLVKSGGIILWNR